MVPKGLERRKEGIEDGGRMGVAGERERGTAARTDDRKTNRGKSMARLGPFSSRKKREGLRRPPQHVLSLAGTGFCPFFQAAPSQTDPVLPPRSLSVVDVVVLVLG